MNNATIAGRATNRRQAWLGVDTWRQGLGLAGLALVVLLVALPAVPQSAVPQSANQQDTASQPGKAKHRDKGKKAAKRAKLAEEAADLPAVMTEDLGNPAELNLYYGAGGADLAPDPNGKYTFMDEDLSQTSPKFDVQDAAGRVWRVKMGAEVHSETAAARLLWAAGYFVDDDYYLDQIKVENLPHLHRGRRFVSTGGIVHHVRLELKRKDIKELGNWPWFDNPFLNTQEWNGLRVMMAVLGNWDLILRNNSVYEVNGKREFLVSDIGATFGKSGGEFGRSKGKLGPYERAKFIARKTPDTVSFDIHARPYPFMIVAPHYYMNLVHGQNVYKDIPRADAKWIGERLSQLSSDQIRDCFRAAGFTPDQIDGYTKTVQERIAELTQL